MLRDARKIKRRRPEIKDYPHRPEAEFTSPEPNSALAKIVGLAGKDKGVLDIGCASGYLAWLLRARGCEVTGVDINPTVLAEARDFCCAVHAVDLDDVALPEVLGDARFDVIIFGDVLEHLRNPGRVLDEARHLLNEGGYVVASIPNIAHGAVRLALVKGSFDYGDLGILDGSHLRFFTIKTIAELFLQCGYTLEQIERTTLPIFSDSDLAPKVVREDYHEALISEIETDPEAETFQFVVKAVPLSDDGRLIEFTKQLLALKAELITNKAAAARHESERSRVRQDVQAARATHALLASTQATLQDTHEGMLKAQTVVEERGRVIADLEASLALARANMQHTREELLKTQAVAEEREGLIAALETSLLEEAESNQSLLASTRATLQNTHEEMLKAQSAAGDRQRLITDLTIQIDEESESSKALLASMRAMLQNAHVEMLKAQAAVGERDRLLSDSKAWLREQSEKSEATLASSQATLQNTHEEMHRAQAAVERLQGELLAATGELNAERVSAGQWVDAYRELEQRTIAQAESLLAVTRAEIDEVTILIGAIQKSSFWSLKLAASSLRLAFGKLMRMFSLQPQR